MLSKKEVKKIKKSAKAAGISTDTSNGDIRQWYTKNVTCKENLFIESCARCRNRLICDGIYTQYARNFGTDEFEPVKGDTILDPLYYRRNNQAWRVLKTDCNCS